MCALLLKPAIGFRLTGFHFLITHNWTRSFKKKTFGTIEDGSYRPHVLPIIHRKC